MRPYNPSKNSGKPRGFPAVLTIDFPIPVAYNTGTPGKKPGCCSGGKKYGLYLFTAAGDRSAVH